MNRLGSVDSLNSKMDESENKKAHNTEAGSMDSNKSDRCFPGQTNLNEFNKVVMQKFVNCTKSFQGLPSIGTTWDFMKTYPEFNREMKKSRFRIMQMMSKVFNHASLKSFVDIRTLDDGEKMDCVINVNDEICERIVKNLDEVEGFFKKAEVLAVNKMGQQDSIQLKTLNLRGIKRNNPDDEELGGAIKLGNTIKRIKVTEKPQLKFSQPVDNSDSPFVPKLKEKPNSIKPLSILPEYDENNGEFFGHPYAVELDLWKPSPNMLEISNLEKPKHLNSTTFEFVCSQERLASLMADISKESEIAVDLEHHSYRSFLGFTCLVQISTKTKDYVIDALALRDHLSDLNNVFTNPKVLKVFHGASSDIEWLQKDFGVYVVGMFDTFVAAKMLNFEKCSLKHLCQHYCQVSLDKSMQLADWRLRPLTDDMLEYSRQDTHYLLYIYDAMKKDLLQSEPGSDELIFKVYTESKKICEKRFQKPSSNPFIALRKTKRYFNNRQFHAYNELYRWRDALSRQKDESTGFILPNHMLLMIAEQLPKEMSGILACCDPTPEAVHTNLGKIHHIITYARSLALHDDVGAGGSQGKRPNSARVRCVQSSYRDFKRDNWGIENYESMEWPVLWNKPKSFEVKINDQPSTKINVLDSQNLRKSNVKEVDYSVYERYAMTQDVLQLLKNPKKKEELDLNDPVLKAVSETIVDYNHVKALPEVKVQEKSEPLEKALPEGEFFVLNPLYKKKSKNPMKKEEDKAIQGEDTPEESKLSSSDEDSEKDPETISFKIKNSKNKSKKKAFFNRLKNSFTRADSTKKHVKADNDEKFIQSTSVNPCPSTSFQKHKVNRKRKRAEESNSRNLDITEPKVTKKERNEAPGKGKDKKKNKFKFWNRKGKSVTFK